MEKKYRKNEQIRGVMRVMLIGEDGSKPQVIPFDMALRQAYEKELDLVEIGPNQSPPVVKIMDYGAYLYHENKKLHENSKRNKEHEVKEVRLRPVTDDGDFLTKSKQIAGFLDKGHKVRVAVRFKGRELANVESGFKIVERLLSSLKEHASIDAAPKMDGKQILCILAPVVKKPKPKEAQSKDEDGLAKEGASTHKKVLTEMA